MSIATGFGVAMAVAGAAAAGSTVANVVGAKSAAKSSKNAAEIQAKGAEQALAYAKEKDAQDRADAQAAQKANYEQWAAKERRMAPYRAAGQAASQTIGPMLGLPAVDIPEPAPTPAFLSAPPLASTTTPTNPRTSAGVNGVGTMADLVPTRTVLMRSPNGQTKAVPETQVDYYTKRGATVVNTNA